MFISSTTEELLSSFLLLVVLPGVKTLLPSESLDPFLGTSVSSQISSFLGGKTRLQQSVGWERGKGFVQAGKLMALENLLCARRDFGNAKRN